MARAALFYLALSLAMVGPHLWPASQLSDFPYDFTDSYIFLWNFWWTKKAATELVSPFFTDYLFYPGGTDLSFHSNPLLYSLISIPVQALLPAPEGLAVAFNAIVLASFVLSGLGAYRLALHVTGSTAGALLAGVVYAFMPFRILNMSRLHVLATEFIPFYILFFLQLLESPSWRRAFFAGLWLSLSFYTSLEYALYLSLFSGLVLIYRAGLRQLAFGRALFTRLAAAAAVFAILASPLLLAQRRAASARTVEPAYPMRALRRWAPALVSFVTPTRYHPLYGPKLRFAGEYGDGSGIHPPGMRSETYLGITALVLAFVGAREARRRRKFFWVVAALTFLLLALGPYLRLTGSWRTDFPLPYQLLYHLVPPLRASRDPTRLLPMLMISMTVLSALGLQSILESCRKRAVKTAAATAFIALVLFEDLLPAPRMTRVAVDALYEEIAREPGDFAIIDLSFGKNAALAQTVHGRKITSGSLLVPRSASIDSSLGVEQDFERPLRILSFDEDARRARLAEDRAEIRRHRIGYVVYSGGSGPRQRLARLLGSEVTPRPPLVFCRFDPARR